MQIHVYDHAQQVGQAAATLLAAQLISKPDSVLGLATGSTPIPTYQALISLYRAGVVDFSSASSFNLDEYVGCLLYTSTFGPASGTSSTEPVPSKARAARVQR